MKSFNQIAASFQSPPAEEHPVYGEKETAMVKALFETMKVNYGGLFLANLDTEKAQIYWEKSWMASIAGKNPERVAAALSFCLNTHAKPFARADFQAAYRSLQPQPEHRLYKVKRLPRNTWIERKEIAREHLAKAKELIGE